MSTTDDAVAAEPEPPASASGLKRLVIRGSAFEIMGYGASQIIRFGSNLILSRLLFPEAFGLSALVNIMNQGLIMLSDVGLPTVIIQSPRGEEPRFLNTAFTWQAVRAIGLFLIACALAFPMAYAFGEEQLVWLIPIGATAVLMLGVRATSYYTLRRRLQLGPLLVVELASQVGAVAVMIPWAMIAPSVWTLVGGMLMSTLISVVGSHILQKGWRNRFEWDTEAAKGMLEFGKWIALSSMLTFASQQGDRLLLGHFLGAAELGIYSIAVFLSGALGEAILRITTGVFFPAYSRVNTEGIGRMRDVFYKTRLLVDGAVIPGIAVLAVLGPWIVQVLYDPRYADAGWMLRVLTVRVAVSCIVAPFQFCLFALGDTRYGFYLNLARTIALVVGVPVGFYLDGVPGLVWAVTLSEIPALIVVYVGAFRAGVLSFLRELRAPVGFALGLGVGLLCVEAIELLGWASLSKVRFH